MTVLKYRFRRFWHLIRIAGADEIARRYFVMNAFDGALTIFGVIIGASLVGVEPRVVVSAGFGAAIAMGISGAWGAYMAEGAERDRALRELERHMFTKLKGSMLDRASKAAALWVAFVDGLSPVLAVSTPLIPFILSSMRILTASIVLPASITLNLATLFMLGIFMGRLSGKNILAHGILTMIAGAVTALLLLILSWILS